MRRFFMPKTLIILACFMRDIAGVLGLHRAGVVQYIRPEILGFVLGSFVAASFREFRARGGFSPLVRFFIGWFGDEWCPGSPRLSHSGCPQTRQW